jgi:TRAF3-interacting protein 1
MTEGGDAEFWKPTSDLFSKLFQKPPMTQKLLLKPPFRYLHDIVTSTLKATSFAPNLFQPEELDSNLVSTKEAKIAFLDKLIDFVNKCTGKKLDVKANKIVAGLEPEKTNLLLQHLHLSATKRLDMPGESVPAKKEEPKKPEPKKEEPKKEEKKEAPKKEMKEEPKKKEEVKKVPKKEEPKKEAKKEAPKKVEPKKEEKKEEPKKEEPVIKKPDPVKEELPKPVLQEIKKSPEIKEDNDNENEGNDTKPLKPTQIPTEALGKIAKDAIKEIEVDNKPPEVEPSKEKSVFRFGSLKGKSKTKETKEVEKIMQDKDIITDPKNLGILKEAIQGLTKSTNPLGKSMDFILEDIDTMTKEYELWRKQYMSSLSQVEEQSKITEEKLQPLQDKLAELEEQIREQHMKICTTKGKIIKNEDVIQTMVLNFAIPKN